MIRVGTAGWQIPARVRDQFPADGSTLQRYAGVFGAVEINSTFYRPSRASTLERWRDSTPDDFLFSLKLAKTITHDRRLLDCGGLIERFLAETAPLGDKRGPILIQLPPSLAFDADVAGAFFDQFRDRYQGQALIEPRHASWFEPEPDALLAAHKIGRVAADPAKVEAAARPGGWTGLRYWRLHGSPRMYVTPYGVDRLTPLAVELRDGDWVMFDNTMSGAAAEDALLLTSILRSG